MKSNFSFTRGLPDRVSDELATVLSTNATFEFKTLFTEVFANLRKRNATSGGEEMLRLRSYEKLQSFVKAGIVERNGKEYKSVAPALKTFMQQSAELKAKIAAGTPFRPAAAPVVAAKAVAEKAVAAKAKPAKKAVRKAPAARSRK